MKDKKGLNIFLMAVVVGAFTYAFMSLRNKAQTQEEDVDLTGRIRDLYFYIKENGSARMNELMKVVDVTERTIRRDLAQLESDGYIKKIGSTKSAEYVLNNE